MQNPRQRARPDHEDKQISRILRFHHHRISNTIYVCPSPKESSFKTANDDPRASDAP